MLPTELPGRLDELFLALQGKRERADQAMTELLQRTLHHVPCNGDGSIVDVLHSDLNAISRWLDDAGGCAASLNYLQVTVIGRLATLARDEATVRGRLAGHPITPAQVSVATQISSVSEHGIADWVQTMAGPIAVPVSGDPAWSQLVNALT